ncbi:proteasome maturation protein [Histomonas meleagridis]|uniref:proteasome maturation protein n=1 Tax=Histomonas meleagridis TaxID=135588 RepID=UPI00355A00DA|nr:proteasome maturation protein [Histomonas meleagridis]KAH0797797.1 proteasome maturation protein [Histomonas meleagridis]
MYEEMIPPMPIDVMREGLPNLRHGKINEHPLEVHLKKIASNSEDQDFKSTAALFGIGFANHLKMERKIVTSTQAAYNGCNLGLELQTGDIDDIDFADVFEPQQSATINYEPHEFQEIRFF